MTILFDGDLLVHRMCAACQENSPFDKTVVIQADPEETWRCIEMRIEQIEDIVSDHFGSPEELVTIVTFSSPKNYRKVVNPDYKSNRKGVAKPVLFSDMVEKTKRLYNCETWDNIEADDVMGIMQDEDTIICTGDKDLLQVAGYHINMIDPESGVFQVNAESGLRLFYTQCLSGDSVDGYYGCPKIGKKKATAIVADNYGSGRMWDSIVKTYEDAMSPKSQTVTNGSGSKRVVKMTPKNLGLGYNDALMTARMAYILQHASDYNRETGEVNLWTP